MPDTSVSQVPLSHKSPSILDYLDRPIAFHRVFVDLAGSVAAALMLSQALYWSKRTRDPDGWFWKTQDEWREETGLKRSEQESARRHLRETTFWHEDRRGLPAKLYFRLDLAALERVLLQQPAPRPLRGPNPQQNHQNAENTQTSLPAPRLLECREAADQSAGIPPTITETTLETTVEKSPESKLNVGNVGVKRMKPAKRLRLTPRQEDVVEELERQLDDTHSRGAFCVIVSDRGLGEDRAMGLLREAIELEDAGRITTTLSQCFMDLCQRDAKRQGIDLGFAAQVPPLLALDAVISGRPGS